MAKPRSLPPQMPDLGAYQRRVAETVNELVRSTGSGTTANRPTANLAAGDYYFDTTLGKPIWYSGSGWVLADGTAA